MKLTYEITIRAPLVKTFAVASKLPRWPEFLPHYRYNRFVSQTPSGGLVRTSCVRSGIKIRWLSEYRIDTKNRQLHFHHLKSTLNAVRGTRAVWDFEELPGGFVRIRISHHLDLKWPSSDRRWRIGWPDDSSFTILRRKPLPALSAK